MWVHGAHLTQQFVIPGPREVSLKRCIQCEEVKPLVMFTKRSDRSGLSPRCYVCLRANKALRKYWLRQRHNDGTIGPS